VKKNTVALVLLAVLVVAAVSYVLLGNKSGSTGATGSFSIDSSGGTIATSDGKITLAVPPDALINQTDITVTQIQNAEVTNYTVISAYQFGPEGTYFLTPATLKITYNPDTLPSSLDQRNLRLFTKVTAGFGQLANSSVDTTNHVVYGHVSHFSAVYVAASESKPEPKDLPIVGKWSRTDGVDKYTFRSSGETQTIINGDPHYGTWTQDDKSNTSKYTLSWDFGPTGSDTFVDHITIASDGKTYEGVNNYGDSIHCVRVVDDQPPTAVIGLPSPPHKVEQEITLHSASDDPDDPVVLLKFLWTVTSPKGEIIDTSTPWLKDTTFTPHTVGDYVVSLTVSDGVLKDTTAVTFTVVPNVELELIDIGSDINTNEVFIYFRATNFGSEPVYIEPRAALAGTRGLDAKFFELGPFEANFAEQTPLTNAFKMGIVLKGYDGNVLSNGRIQVPMPSSGDKITYTVTAVPWNAYLTVGDQITRFSDSKWAATFTLDAGSNVQIIGAAP
jgi:hypothetical protein